MLNSSPVFCILTIFILINQSLYGNIEPKSCDFNGVIPIEELINCDCSLSVEINEDVEFCEPGFIDLNATITGNYDSFEWTSDQGFSNTTDPNPTIFVDQTTTFTFTAIGPGNSNLVTNGDFEDGFVGFTSDYTFNPNTNVNGLAQSSFNIDNQVPNLWMNQCDPIDGNMMVVNGATVGNVDIYCTTVSVCPDTDYTMGAMIMNINNPAPSLQFSANGTLLGAPQTGGTPCTVVEFNEVWNSGSEVSLKMCFVNQNTSGGGNDFAIDNIEIREICTLEESFVVEVEELDAFIEEPPVLNCFAPINSLNVEIVDGQANSYSWSTVGGNILSDLTLPEIDINAPGIYTVDIAYGINCIETLEVEVTENFSIPNILFDPPIEINCVTPFSAINIHPTSPTPYNFEWTHPNGTSTFEEDIFFTEDAGNYLLEVQDSESGCTNVFIIEIEENLDTIEVDYSFSNPLDCNNSQSTIILDLSETADHIEWSTGLVDVSELVIQNSGIYGVTVTNFNGCESIASIEVLEDVNSISYSLEGNSVITCNNDTLLNYLTGLNQDITATWFYNTEIINSDSIYIAEEGWYFFLLESPSGCSAMDSIFISSDISTPEFQVITDTLTCSIPTIELTVDVNNEFSNILWITPEGIEFNQDSLDTSLPGTYQVQVTGINGCVSTVEFDVEQDDDFPEIGIDGIDTLDCNTAEFILTGSSSLPTVIEQWILPSTDIIVDQNISISEPGLYTYFAETENGCITTREIEIILDTMPPNLNFQPNTILNCNNPTVTNSIGSIQEIVGMWYQENELISTDDEFTTEEPGAYTLEVIGINGCSEEYEFDITIDTLHPDLEVNFNNINCISDISNITVTTDASSYTIEDLIGGTIVFNQDLNTINEGSYLISAMNDNGCEVTEEITISIDTLPPTIDLTLNDQQLNCTNEEVQVSVTSVNTDIIYSWTGPNTFTSSIMEPILTEPGTYDLEITADNGCMSTYLVELEIDTTTIPLSLMGSDIDCIDTSAVLIINNEDEYQSYLWLDENGNEVSTLSSTTITNGGLYEAQAILANGCMITETIFIDENIQEIDLELSSSAIELNCIQNEITITLENNGADIDIEWFLDGADINANDQIIVDQAGVYSVIGTGNSGCTGTDELTITIDTLSPSPDIEITPFDCESEIFEVFVETSDASSLFFNNTISLDGIYSDILNEDNSLIINIIGENGCTYDSTIQYNAFEYLETSAIDTILFNEGDLVQMDITHNRLADEIESIVWSPSDLLSCDNCLNPVYSLNESQTFEVTITDVYGCEETETIYLQIVERFVADIYVPNAYNPYGINGHFKFKGYGNPEKIESIELIAIYDRWGNLVFKQENISYEDENYGWDGKYKGINVVQGVYSYILDVNFIDGSSDQKVGNVTIIR